MEKNITLTDNSNNILYPKAQPCGVDTSNVIATYSGIGDTTYTAINDCFVKASYSGMSIWIDDVQICGSNDTGTSGGENIFLLHKGQKIRLTWGNNNQRLYVYGVKH